MSRTSLIGLGGGGGGSPDISFAVSIVDQPLDGQIITISIPSYLTVTIAEAMEGSSGHADVVGTAIADFDVHRNGVSVGTIRFGIGSASPSFIMATETIYVGGDSDYMSIICPNPADVTLASIGITIKGTKS